MTSVRMTPYVKHLWRALSEDERDELESLVPDGHFVSVIYRTSLTDLTVRLFRQDKGESVRIAKREHQRDIAEGIRLVLFDAALDVAVSA